MYWASKPKAMSVSAFRDAIKDPNLMTFLPTRFPYGLEDFHSHQSRPQRVRWSTQSSRRRLVTASWNSLDYFLVWSGEKLLTYYHRPSRRHSSELQLPMSLFINNLVSYPVAVRGVSLYRSKVRYSNAIKYPLLIYSSVAIRNRYGSRHSRDFATYPCPS